MTDNHSLDGRPALSSRALFGKNSWAIFGSYVWVINSKRINCDDCGRSVMASLVDFDEGQGWATWIHDGCDGTGSVLLWYSPLSHAWLNYSFEEDRRCWYDR